MGGCEYESSAHARASAWQAMMLVEGLPCHAVLCSWPCLLFNIAKQTPLAGWEAEQHKQQLSPALPPTCRW